MISPLRIIYDSASPAYFNMAVDETLLDRNLSGNSHPVLRFYSWSEPTLSVGCNQKTSDINFDLLKEKGISFVRRPTGGRAVLHQNGITYSTIIPLSKIPDKSVYESCRLIHSAIYNALNKMGINTSQNLNKKVNLSNPVCFSYPSYSELTFEGKKIVGSAQMRRSHFLMQHGSIPFKGEPFSIFSFFNSLPEHEISQGITLESKEEEKLLKKNIQEEFCLIFNFKSEIDKLTDSELTKVRELELNKYGSDNWTFKR